MSVACHSIDDVVREAARSCGSLVIECADVAGYVASVSAEANEQVAGVARLDAAAAGLTAA